MTDFPAHLNIFRNGKSRNQHKLLMYNTDSQLHGLYRAVDLHFLSVNLNGSFKTACVVNDRHTKQDIHQGGFSCAVFSHQRMNLTGTYRKVNSLQDTVPEIFFHNMIHFQDIGFFCIFQNTNLFLFDFFFYRPPSGKNEKRSPPASAPKTPAGEPPASYISPIAVKSI